MNQETLCIQTKTIRLSRSRQCNSFQVFVCLFFFPSWSPWLDTVQWTRIQRMGGQIISQIASCYSHWLLWRLIHHHLCLISLKSRETGWNKRMRIGWEWDKITNGSRRIIIQMKKRWRIQQYVQRIVHGKQELTTCCKNIAEWGLYGWKHIVVRTLYKVVFSWSCSVIMVKVMYPGIHAIITHMYVPAMKYPVRSFEHQTLDSTGCLHGKRIERD